MNKKPCQRSLMSKTGTMTSLPIKSIVVLTRFMLIMNFLKLYTTAAI